MCGRLTSLNDLLRSELTEKALLEYPIYLYSDHVREVYIEQELTNIAKLLIKLTKKENENGNR